MLAYDRIEIIERVRERGRACAAGSRVKKAFKKGVELKKKEKKKKDNNNEEPIRRSSVALYA